MAEKEEGAEQKTVRIRVETEGAAAVEADKSMEPETIILSQEKMVLTLRNTFLMIKTLL